MTEPTKISLDMLLEKVQGKCEGSCHGSGVGVIVAPYACPEPCKPLGLSWVKEDAKSEAWSKAQELCSKVGGEYCVCDGEYHALIPEQCVNIKKADGTYACLYFASYIYMGKCRTLI